MIRILREILKRRLPPPLRHIVGSAAGHLDICLFRPVQGFIFSCMGGVFHADGCRFEIPRNLTSISYRACFFRGDYELEERELVQRFLRDDDSIIELGACLGIVSNVANRMLRDRSKHLVVEGNPYVIPSIHRNRELNESEFIVENAAVSNDREVTFFIHPVYIVGGTTERASGRSVKVPGRTLVEFDERYGPFTVMIMDIEGSELSSLRSAGSLLRKLRLVVIELHQWAIGEDGVNECREILREAGLQLAGSAGITEAWERPPSQDES